MLNVNVMPTPKETSRNLPQDERISILISVVLVLNYCVLGARLHDN
jgi:hypothetical protein